MSEEKFEIEYTRRVHLTREQVTEAASEGDGGWRAPEFKEACKAWLEANPEPANIQEVISDLESRLSKAQSHLAAQHAHLTREREDHERLKYTVRKLCMEVDNEKARRRAVEKQLRMFGEACKMRKVHLQWPAHRTDLKNE